MNILFLRNSHMNFCCIKFNINHEISDAWMWEKKISNFKVLIYIRGGIRGGKQGRPPKDFIIFYYLMFKYEIK
jgi:hypothetical protein